MKLAVFSTGYCTARESHLMRGGSPHKSVRCPARAYLLDHPQGNILFDTGYAHARLFRAAFRFPYSLYLKATPTFTRPDESLMAQLGETAILKVIVSHFHADHIGGLRDFPDARFVCAGEAFDAIKNRRGLPALRCAFLPELLPADFAARTELLGEFAGAALPPFGPTHDLFGDGSIRLVRLPGHARGQLGLLARTDEGTVFLVADAAYSVQAIREGRPPHRITDLFVDDGRAARATLDRLRSFAAAHPNIALYPTHDPEPDR